MQTIPYFGVHFSSPVMDATRSEFYAVRAYWAAKEHRAPAPTFYDMATPEQRDWADTITTFRKHGVSTLLLCEQRH